MLPWCALVALAATAAALPVDFDQRQEGSYNVHATLENFVLLLIPTPTETQAILSLLAKTHAAAGHKFHQRQKPEVTLQLGGDAIQGKAEEDQVKADQPDVIPAKEPSGPVQAPAVEPPKGEPKPADRKDSAREMRLHLLGSNLEDCADGKCRPSRGRARAFNVHDPSFLQALRFGISPANE